MKRIFFAVLFVFFINSLVVAQPVTQQEITALKTQIQNLINNYALQKRSGEINYLKDTLKRLEEVDDMPLSRAEADQIKTRLGQFTAKP